MSVLAKITKEAQMLINPSRQQEFIDQQHIKAHIHGNCKCKKDLKRPHVKYHLMNCLNYANADPLKTPLPLSCSCRIGKVISEDEIVNLLKKLLVTSDGSDGSDDDEEEDNDNEEEEVKDDCNGNESSLESIEEATVEYSKKQVKNMCNCCRGKFERQNCQRKNEINTKAIEDVVAYIEGEEKVEKQIDMKKSSSVEDEEYKEMKDLNKKLESLASYVSNTQNRLKQLKSTATKKKQTKVDNLKKNLNDYNKSKNKIENRIEQIVQEIDDFVCFKKKYEKFKYVMKHVNKLTNIKEEKVENKHVDEEVEEEEDSDHHLDNDNESSSRFVDESSEIEFVTCETSLENQEIESNKLYFKTEFEEKIQTILKNCPYLIYNPDGYFDFREDVEYEQNYGKRPVSFRQAFPSFFN